MEHSVYERPSKRPHLEQQKDQISSSTDSLSPVEKVIFSSMAPKDSTCKRASCAFSSERLAVEPRCSHPQKEKMSSNCHTREPIKPRTKQSVSDEADFAEPPAAVHPGNGNSLLLIMPVLEYDCLLHSFSVPWMMVCILQCKT